MAVDLELSFKLGSWFDWRGLPLGWELLNPGLESHTEGGGVVLLASFFDIFLEIATFV